MARLDWLGRSPRELIDLVGEFEGRGVGFRSPKEALGTTTAGGGLIFHVFGALAELGDHPREEGGRANVGPDAGSRHRGHGNVKTAG